MVDAFIHTEFPYDFFEGDLEYLQSAYKKVMDLEVAVMKENNVK